MGMHDRPITIRFAHVDHRGAIVLRTLAGFGPYPILVPPTLVGKDDGHVAVDDDAQITGGVALVALETRSIEIPDRKPVFAAVVLVSVQVEEDAPRIVAP